MNPIDMANMNTTDLHARGDGLRRPATYFLQEAIELGLSAIDARLDRNDDYRPFFFMQLKPHAELQHQIWDFGDMTSRFADAFMLGREATGSRKYADAEAGLLRGLKQCDPFANPFMSGRMLLTYVDLYLASPSSEAKECVDSLVKAIGDKLTIDGKYAYWFKQADDWRSMTQPLGDFTPYPTYPLGGIALALSRYVEAGCSGLASDLLDKICNFILEKSGTYEPDGRYQGHTHSGGILTATAAILRWAINRGDHETIELMRKAFDWTRAHSSSWGWIPDGLEPVPSSSETCSITDAIHCGILLARHVDPCYWEIVESWARNQLLENQIRRPELLLNEDDALNEDIMAALRGSWASWSLPNSLDNLVEGVEGCCLGSGIRGCWLAWQSCIEADKDGVRVNMAFSRNSPWLEVISHQPYEGRMDIVIHDAPKLKVRIPTWIAGDELTAEVDGKLVPVTHMNGGYVEFTGLVVGQVLTLKYPQRHQETTEHVGGHDYRVTWRGDTVTRIDPPGNIYPIFERNWMNSGEVLPAASSYEDQTGERFKW